MNRILSLFLALLCLSACSKHQSNPTPPVESNIGLNVTIDPSLGNVARSATSDTFLIQLKNPSIVAAVPVVLHFAAGATPSAGNELTDSTWSDTVDISQNRVYPVTITAKNGQSSKYGIAFQYIINSYPLDKSLGSLTPGPIFFQGDTLYTGGTSGLYYYNTDVEPNGESPFTQVAALNGAGISSIYVNGSTIYAGCQRGLEISTDGGQTFTNHAFDTIPVAFNTVNAVYVQGDTVYAGDLEGLWISRNGGGTYTYSINGLGANYVSDIYAQGSTVYAATMGGLSISTNGGAFFTNYINGLGGISGFDRCYGVAIQNGVIYVATLGGISVSSDNGASFNTNPITNVTGPEAVNGVYVQGDTVCAATYGEGLALSTDGGASFVSFTTINGLAGNIVYSVTMHNGSIYAGCEGGMAIITPRK
jgi:hypothetical protein